MESLSSRQKRILDFINHEIHTKGYPPSVREIGAAVDLKSSSTVHSHLEQLERKGYIRRNPAKPRAIEVIKKIGQPTKETVNIPLVGEITAGQPILADEKIEELFPLPKEWVRGDKTFMLSVSGESMIEAGIFDGDLLIIRQQNYADNGDIVAALLENEATVKRFFKEASCVRLQPENSSMEPIYTNEVMILGKVIGLVRRY